MRNYSKPPFHSTELGPVCAGLCELLNEPYNRAEILNINCFIPIGRKINDLASKYGSKPCERFEIGYMGIATQSLIETLISKGVKTYSEIEKFVDEEVAKVPPGLMPNIKSII